MYTSMSIAPPHSLQGDLVQVALRGISGRLAESVVMQGAAAMNYRNIQRGGRAEAKSHHKSAGMADDSCACTLADCLPVQNTSPALPSVAVEAELPNLQCLLPEPGTVSTSSPSTRLWLCSALPRHPGGSVCIGCQLWVSYNGGLLP